MIEPSALRLIAALIAKRLAMFLRENTLSIRVIGEHHSDIVREFDIEAEQFLLKLIRMLIPKSIVITEESGIIQLDSNPEYIILADPVDGSNNYATQIPWCSTSVAIAYAKKAESLNDIVASAVASIFTSDLYTYSVEEGVLHNEKPLSRLPEPQKLVIVYLDSSKDYEFLRRFRERNPKTKIRSLGSISLDLMLVTKNAIEAVIDIRSKLRNVDIAAVYPMVKRVGGYIELMDRKAIPIHELVHGISLIAASKIEVLRHIMELLIS